VPHPTPSSPLPRLALLALALGSATRAAAQQRASPAPCPDTAALAPSREWYLESDDKRAYLDIREVGAGAPVVVIHGGPGAGNRYLLGLARGLDRDFRFVFYDQRGAGLSMAARRNISMPLNVQDLETIRQALGLDRLTIVSHSAGTYLAMEYLRTHPDRVGNIVLVGATDPINGKKEYFSDEETARYAKLPEVVAQFSARPAVQAEIRRAGLDRDSLTAQQRHDLWRIRQSAGSLYHIERWRENPFIMIRADGAQGARDGMNFDYNWAPMLAQHPHAITVINGRYDYQVGVEGSPIWARVVARDARNVKLVVLDEAGHSPWIDQPVEFRRIMRDALTRRR
jgi:pimeloyl-ACP methyl ester carboxylesterase